MSDTMIEAWRPVRGLEDLYEVSDQGNVRSLRFINGATNKERDVPLVLQPHRDKKDGRRRINLKRRGELIRCRVAVLVLTAFVGPAPPGMECCHNNSVASDDRLDNLRWDTRIANARDALLKTQPDKRFRLTEDDVRCIRAEPDFRGVNSMLARAFGVTTQAIWRLRHGFGWSHVVQ